MPFWNWLVWLITGLQNHSHSGKDNSSKIPASSVTAGTFGPGNYILPTISSLTVVGDQNTETILKVTNGTSGTFAYATLAVGASASSLLTQLDSFSAGYTATGGDDAASGSRLLANGDGGLALRVSSGSGTFRLYMGTTLRLNIGTGGALTLSAYGAGVLHSDSSGVVTSSAITPADTDNGVNPTTYTPVIGGTSTAGTQTYGTQVGRYSRIGPLVFAQARVVLTAFDAATAGQIYVSLPVAMANVGNAYATAAVEFGNVTLSAGYTNLTAMVAPNTSQARIYQAGSTKAVGILDTAGMGATSEFTFSVVYLAA